MRNQFVDTFLQECEDLLPEIEECALGLHDTDDYGETVGRLFRAFHTIKGSGAMVGLDHLAAFTHHVETMLDGMREGRISVAPRIVELILASVDEIKRLMQLDPGSPLPPSEARDGLVAELEQFALSPAMSKVADAQSQAVVTVAEVEEPAKRCWNIVFQPDPNLFLTGGNPFGLLRELKELGTIEVLMINEAVPHLQDMDPTTCYLGWTITLVTAADENAIRDVFVFVEDGAELSITPVDEVKATGQDAAPAQKAPENAQPAPRRTELGARKEESDQPLKRSPEKQQSKESVVRVPSGRLDRLVNLVGELVMNQSRLMRAAVTTDIPELMQPVQEMERLVAELRDDVLGIRMLPIGTIFGRFRRLVHDLSAELGKEVDLVTEGAETELDKSILDQLSEPLVHLLRNSIDHGIEPGDRRVELGKPRRGTIRLAAMHAGSHVVISIDDDGKGIDRAAVRAKAIERKLIAPDVVLPDSDLLNLILQPGFSTAQKLTSVSGRGVGMDVVKKQIDSLRGSLKLTSDEGQGSRVALFLPLTLAIIEGLNVEIGADQFIIPMSAITENVELEHAKRSEKNGRNVVVIRGELVPYIDLRSAFRIEGAPPAMEKVVIVRYGEDRVGLVVDRVLGTHQTVLQSLGRFLRSIDVVSGATIMGDGRVALILDVASIVRTAGSQAD